MPELRKTTLRWSETIRALIEEEAELDGTSFAQFVREAALGRVMYQRGQRGEDPERLARDLGKRVYAELRERLGDDDQWDGPERRRAPSRRRSR